MSLRMHFGAGQNFSSRLKFSIIMNLAKVLLIAIARNCYVDAAV